MTLPDRQEELKEEAVDGYPWARLRPLPEAVVAWMTLRGLPGVESQLPIGWAPVGLMLATYIKRLWATEFNWDLTPSEISPNSHRWFWWRCGECDNYFYQSVARLAQGIECNYCAGRATMPFVNDMTVTEPEISLRWDHEANGFPAYLAGPGNGRQYTWRCPRKHQMIRSLSEMRRLADCPTCENRVLCAGFNDVATIFAEHIERWDPALNHGLPPTAFLAAGDALLGWRCPLGHPYWKSALAMISNPECSVCSNHRSWRGFNTLLARYGSICADFDSEGNHGLDPDTILPGNLPRFWTCKYMHTRWERAVNRLRTKGCPDCPADLRACNRIENPRDDQ